MRRSGDGRSFRSTCGSSRQATRRVHHHDGPGLWCDRPVATRVARASMDRTAWHEHVSIRRYPDDVELGTYRGAGRSRATSCPSRKDGRRASTPRRVQPGPCRDLGTSHTAQPSHRRDEIELAAAAPRRCDHHRRQSVRHGRALDSRFVALPISRRWRSTTQSIRRFACGR